MKASRLLTLLVAVLVWRWLPPAAAAERAAADAVKAGFLVKFGAFVDWPPSAFPAAGTPFKLCVAGNRSSGGLIDRAARGKVIGGHPIEVQHFAALPADSRCQLLFVSDTAQPSVADVLAAVRGKPVLTVTDRPPEAGNHGIINFVIRNNRVRFQIDNRQAAQGGLRISSQLLALAVR